MPVWLPVCLSGWQLAIFVTQGLCSKEMTGSPPTGLSLLAGDQLRWGTQGQAAAGQAVAWRY